MATDTETTLYGVLYSLAGLDDRIADVSRRLYELGDELNRLKKGRRRESEAAARAIRLAGHGDSIVIGPYDSHWRVDESGHVIQVVAVSCTRIGLEGDALPRAGGDEAPTAVAADPIPAGPDAEAESAYLAALAAVED